MHPDLGGGFGPSYRVTHGFDFVDRDSDPRDTCHGAPLVPIASDLVDSAVASGRSWGDAGKAGSDFFSSDSDVPVFDMSTNLWHLAMNRDYPAFVQQQLGWRRPRDACGRYRGGQWQSKRQCAWR